VELFLNGQSLGKKSMTRNGSLAWPVKYEPGTLSAKGYDHDKVIAETKIETTDEPATVRLEPDRTIIAADGRDVSIIAVSAVDSHGRIVPTANNLLHFELSGPGRIIGVGNGDPSSHEADHGNQRKLFGGLAQILIQSTASTGKMQLTAAGDALKPATVTIRFQDLH
jgi:beta-galactosidase